MDPQEQRLEVEALGPDDDDLAVEDAPLGQRARQGGDELREVAVHRLLVPALQQDLVAVAKDQRAEAVPFGLELPSLAAGQGLGGGGQHGGERRRERQAHANHYAGGGATTSSYAWRFVMSLACWKTSSVASKAGRVISTWGVQQPSAWYVAMVAVSTARSMSGKNEASASATDAAGVASSHARAWR